MAKLAGSLLLFVLLASAPGSAQAPGGAGGRAQAPGGAGGWAQMPGGAGGRAQVGLSGASQELPVGAGEAKRVVAYCGSLLDDEPSLRDEYLPEPGAGAIVAADGSEMGLREAVLAGLAAVRGRGPMDPPRPARALWIDLYLVNRTTAPFVARIPAGAVFQPQGGAGPDIPQLGAIPGGRLTQVAAVLERAGVQGSDVACFAAWVATGSTLGDIEHTLVRPVSEREVAATGAVLREAGLPAADEGREEYATLYQKALAECGADPSVRELTVRFPSGMVATLAVTRGAEGHATAEVRAKGGRVLRYAAGVTQDARGRWQVRLIHLKTGRPVPGLPTYTLAQHQR